MNITVFGGTGPAGLLLLNKLVVAGHVVTAYARNPAKIDIRRLNLHLIQGELNEPHKINEAVRGANAVITLLGPKSLSREPIIANGTKNIIDAMKRNKVNRLIATVSSSYRDPKDKFQFGFDFGVVMLKVIGKSILREIEETGLQISSSQLDWTMVRLPKLSNKPRQGKWNIGYTGDGKIKFFSLTRADLADILAAQLDDKTLIGKAPVISN